MRTDLIESWLPGRPGEMDDYDIHLLPKAILMLDHLKERPSFRWWNFLLRRPESLRDAGERLRGEDGYSLFLGWDSFVCRNMTHEVSREIYCEFRRVFGRPVSLYD